MYGRCATDPFDQASDVCDSCYGEFCSACLVKTKGRKHPICKECAIIASGVRPGAKALLRGSKKTAAERRRSLKDAPPAPKAFEYFDDQPDAAGEPEPASLPNSGSDSHSDPIPVPIPAALGEQPPPGRAEHGRAPAEPGVDEPLADDAEPITPVARGVAALAKHQADLRAARPAPEPVEQPEWLAAPVQAARSERRPDEISPWPGDESIAEAGDGTPMPGPSERADDKPVTDGFDWVTEMPPRGSSTPLPSRSAANGATGGPVPSPSTGAVATADRPGTGLPRRRSTLRSSDRDAERRNGDGS